MAVHLYDQSDPSDSSNALSVRSEREALIIQLTRFAPLPEHLCRRSLDSTDATWHAYYPLRDVAAAHVLQALHRTPGLRFEGYQNPTVDPVARELHAIRVAVALEPTMKPANQSVEPPVMPVVRLGTDSSHSRRPRRRAWWRRTILRYLQHLYQHLYQHLDHHLYQHLSRRGRP